VKSQIKKNMAMSAAKIKNSDKWVSLCHALGI